MQGRDGTSGTKAGGHNSGGGEHKGKGVQGYKGRRAQEWEGSRVQGQEGSQP